MELNQDDLKYFVAFVLLDAATRRPSGKRQTAPLKGVWLCYAGRQHMRGLRGDSPRRRRVCIRALQTIEGKSVFKAAADVAAVLRDTQQMRGGDPLHPNVWQGTLAEVNVIRTDYQKRECNNASWDLFVSQYFELRLISPPASA